jgi:hypothetical protein
MFPLKPQQERKALYCDPGSGPVFGRSDLRIQNKCNTGLSCHTMGFGVCYVNDTGLGGPEQQNAFFTGSVAFNANEIEVFQMLE